MRHDRERLIDILQVRWRSISGLRNFLIHQYFGVHRPLVWEVATEEVPVLRSQIAAILATEFPE